MKRTLIHNATIVNEGQSVKGSVEVLTNWKPLSAPCDETIDATGCYLLPGIIDDHVHFRDPGLTHKADILTESRAAAAGGVTSIMDMPNTNPVTTTLDALNAKLDLLNEKCIVNHSCYFGATNDNYSEFGKLDKHRVCGIKLFMGSSTGNMLVDKMNSLLNIFNGTDMLIAAHCEDQETIKNNIAKYKEMFAGENDIPIGKHPYIRSSAACYASSELAVRLARIAGARLHILHVSTAKELQLFNDYSLSEKHITAEACVAHLLFTLSDYRTLGTRIKCNPAIKKQADRDALRAAVNSGLIDVIATDHAPHLLSGGQKQRVAIAGVIAMRPDCLILDESTAMLDPRGRAQVMKTIRNLRDAGISIVSITHYMEEAAQADRILVMSRGRIVMEGTPEQVFSQTKRLHGYHLDVPQATELRDELAAAGLPMPENIITPEECAKAIFDLLK